MEGEESLRGPPYVLLHLKQMDNARREMDGLEPVLLTPEEAEQERGSERDALKNLILQMRADPGSLGEEAQALLDKWEEELRASS